jgi:hypothetical protein
MNSIYKSLKIPHVLKGDLTYDQQYKEKVEENKERRRLHSAAPVLPELRKISDFGIPQSGGKRKQRGGRRGSTTKVVQRGGNTDDIIRKLGIPSVIKGDLSKNRFHIKKVKENKERRTIAKQLQQYPKIFQSGGDGKRKKSQKETSSKKSRIQDETYDKLHDMLKDIQLGIEKLNIQNRDLEAFLKD